MACRAKICFWMQLRTSSTSEKTITQNCKDFKLLFWFILVQICCPHSNILTAVWTLAGPSGQRVLWYFTRLCFDSSQKNLKTSLPPQAPAYPFNNRLAPLLPASNCSPPRPKPLQLTCKHFWGVWPRKADKSTVPTCDTGGSNRSSWSLCTTSVKSSAWKHTTSLVILGRSLLRDELQIKATSQVSLFTVRKLLVHSRVITVWRGSGRTLALTTLQTALPSGPPQQPCSASRSSGPHGQHGLSSCPQTKPPGAR